MMAPIWFVKWEPGVDNPAGTRVVVNLATGWHGASNLITILCDAEDDGELTIPASMVAEFKIPSCGECEMSYMGRYTRSTLETDGGLFQLQVLTRKSFVAWMN